MNTLSLEISGGTSTANMKETYVFQQLFLEERSFKMFGIRGQRRKFTPSSRLLYTMYVATEGNTYMSNM